MKPSEKRKRCGNCRWYTRGKPDHPAYAKEVTGTCWEIFRDAKRGKCFDYDKMLWQVTNTVHPNYRACDDWEPEP